MNPDREITIYVLVYFGFFLAFCLIWKPVMVESSRAEAKAKEEALALVPNISDQQLKKRIEVISEMVEKGVGDHPQVYFDTLTRIYETEKSLKKLISKNDGWDSYMRYWFKLERFKTEHVNTQREYLAKFGEEAVIDAHDEFFETTDGGYANQYDVNHSMTKTLSVDAYIQTILLTVLFFMVRLYQKGVSIALELWKVMLWSLVWFVGVWKYPKDILRIEQLRSMYRFVGAVISILISMLPVSGLVKAADKKSGGKRDEASVVIKNYAFTNFIVKPFGAKNDAKNLSTRFVRIGANISSDSGYGGGLQLELVGMNESRANFLRQAYLQYSTKNSWFRAGRLILGAGMSAPFPATWNTVNFPSIAYNLHAWGLQFSHNFGNNLIMIADVSTKSGELFYDSSNFDSVETSGRLLYVEGNYNLAFNYQMGKNMRRFGFDGGYDLSNKLRINSSLHRVDDVAYTGKVGHIYLGYEFLRDIKLHTQVSKSFGGRKLWTNGFQFLNLFGNRLSVTVDHERALNNKADSQTLVRFQLVY